MATTFTLTRPETFPEGTSVGAYPKSNWPAVEQAQPAGAPKGAATSTKTVTGGAAAFTGLTDATEYWAVADLGGGNYRYVRFLVGADVPGDALDPSQFPADSLTTAQLGPNSVGSSELADNAVDTAAIAAGAVTAAKVAADVATQAELDANAAIDTAILARYRTLIATAGRFSTSGAISTKYFAIPGISDQSAPAGNIASLGASFIKRLLAADLPSIGGVAPKLRITAMILTVAAPTQSYKFGLYPVVAGATISLGTLVSGSDAGLTIATPAANSIVTATGTDFALPADGNYAIGYEIIGGAPLQSATLQAFLEVHWA